MLNSRLFLPVLSLVLLGVGCGSGDDDDGGKPGSGGTTNEASGGNGNEGGSGDATGQTGGTGAASASGGSGGTSTADDGGANTEGDQTAFTASDAPVVINEFMPSNSTGATDDAGAAPDWIELYNRSDADVDLTGYYISDDATDPQRQQLTGLSIPQGGTLILWADGDVEEGTDHLEFKLSAAGEVVLLSSPDGELLDRIAWDAATTDVSFARVPDGTGEFGACSKPTPQGPNDASCAAD